MFGLKIGPLEVLVVIIVALVLFGPSKLPELGRSVGRTINEFKKGTQEFSDEIRKSMDDENKDEE